MQYQLKDISPDAVPHALNKAHRYRLLNEPSEAQSICEDILRIDSQNQDALVILLLAITDQFDHGTARRDAEQLLPRLKDEYNRTYFAGIIAERMAKVILRRATPGSNHAAYMALEEAMDCFERAQKLSPSETDDAILRWNACARMLMRNPSLQPPPRERYQEVIGE
ncbi:MAG TPA: hypothetical protein VE621_23420 [Bryobacteraceae bacterium]|nr:hypothetical protein [Bryobacteraceae bacterium]